MLLLQKLLDQAKTETDDLLESIEQEVNWNASAAVSINGNDTIEFLTQFAATNSRGYVEPMGD